MRIEQAPQPSTQPHARSVPGHRVLVKPPLGAQQNDARIGHKAPTDNDYLAPNSHGWPLSAATPTASISTSNSRRHMSAQR